MSDEENMTDEEFVNALTEAAGKSVPVVIREGWLMSLAANVMTRERVEIEINERA